MCPVVPGRVCVRTARVNGACTVHVHVHGSCARCMCACTVHGGGGLHEEPRDLHGVEHPPELLHDETRVLDVLVHLNRVGG